MSWQLQAGSYELRAGSSELQASQRAKRAKASSSCLAQKYEQFMNF